MGPQPGSLLKLLQQASKRGHDRESRKEEGIARTAGIIARGKKETKTRILQNMVSGIPVVLGLRTKMQDTYVDIPCAIFHDIHIYIAH